MVDDVRENIQTFLYGEREREMVAANVFSDLARKHLG